MSDMQLQKLKKALVGGKGYIRLGKHSKERLQERGYYEKDILNCLETGKIPEIKEGYNHRLNKKCKNITLEGLDSDGNPMVVIFSEEADYSYTVVTVIPPTDKRRFERVI